MVKSGTSDCKSFHDRESCLGTSSGSSRFSIKSSQWMEDNSLELDVVSSCAAGTGRIMLSDSTPFPTSKVCKSLPWMKANKPESKHRVEPLRLSNRTLESGKIWAWAYSLGLLECESRCWQQDPFEQIELFPRYTDTASAPTRAWIKINSRAHSLCSQITFINLKLKRLRTRRLNF